MQAKTISTARHGLPRKSSLYFSLTIGNLLLILLQIMILWWEGNDPCVTTSLVLLAFNTVMCGLCYRRALRREANRSQDILTEDESK
ncbi:MAG: hypothetical protein Tsb009_35650 [Planctomycetaceae bacterium]